MRRLILQTPCTLNGRFIVYAHRKPGCAEPFHLGSGSLSRAMAPKRSPIWRQIAGDEPVEVVILESYQCEVRAQLREAQLIQQHQPVANYHHRHGPHPGVLDGRRKKGKRCGCGAPDCYGAEVAAREAAAQAAK